MVLAESRIVFDKPPSYSLALARRESTSSDPSSIFARISGKRLYVTASAASAPAAASRHPVMALAASSSDKRAFSKSARIPSISETADFFVLSIFPSKSWDASCADPSTFWLTVDENPWLICRMSVWAAESVTLVATALYFSLG